MNRDEAKYILSVFHLGGQDVEDPQFREALELSKQDPVLGAWFANEQAIDARISQKFTAFPVPAELTTRLFAARKIIPARAWWQRPAWERAAACLLLVLVLSGWLLHSAGRPRFTEFRTFVADSAAQLEHLDLLSTNLAEVRQWLQERNAPSDFVVPAGIHGRPSIGCRKFSWNGRPIGLVCFKIDKVGTAHLFVMNRATLRHAPGANPEFALSNNGVATASWSKDQRIYVLAGKMDERQLRRLLKS